LTLLLDQHPDNLQELREHCADEEIRTVVFAGDPFLRQLSFEGFNSLELLFLF